MSCKISNGTSVIGSSITGSCFASSDKTVACSSANFAAASNAAFSAFDFRPLFLGAGAAIASALFSIVLSDISFSTMASTGRSANSGLITGVVFSFFSSVASSLLSRAASFFFISKFSPLPCEALYTRSVSFLLTLTRLRGVFVVVAFCEADNMDSSSMI